MVVRVNNGRNQNAKKLEGSFCLVSVSLGPISKQLEVFSFSFFFFLWKQCCLRRAKVPSLVDPVLFNLGGL